MISSTAGPTRRALPYSFLLWLGPATSKWHSWKDRYGKDNEHNASLPRDHWLTAAEKQAIIDFQDKHPLEGYRRLTFMMLDADIVACSPASVYRVLKAAGLLDRHNPKPSSKGQGFVQLTRARQIPAGSQVDARAGTIRLTAAAATKNGKLQTGTFKGAIFGVAQDSRGISKGLTTLSLVEGAFRGAPTFASCRARKARDGSRVASAAVSSKVLQALLASAHGHFRTKGRFSAATVRGTQWGERDRCDGSVTVVRRGTVLVTDFVRHVTVIVRAGHTYLARAPRTGK